MELADPKKYKISRDRSGYLWASIVLAGYLNMSFILMFMTSTFDWVRLPDSSFYFVWFLFSPWMIYVFVAQHLIEQKDGVILQLGQRSTKENILFTSVTFLAGTVSIILYSMTRTGSLDQWLFDTLFMVGYAAVTYLALVVFNKRWKIN